MKKSSSKPSKLLNPHDKFFREVFSRKEEVQSFLRGALPSPLLQKIDLDSLQREDTTYLDKLLKEHFSDVVYTCIYQPDIPIQVAFLLEHKSYVPHEMPVQFQLLKYMIGIWEHNQKQKQPLMPVIPIIVYHGKESWQKKSLTQYFEEKLNLPPENPLSRFIPSFEYILTDLSAYPDEEIKQLFDLVSLQTALLLMKKIFDEALLDELKNIAEQLNKLLKTEAGREFYKTILLYLYYGSSLKNNKTKIILAMNQISEQAGEMALSIAEQLKQEGREQGREQEKRESIRRLIRSGLLNLEQIAAIQEVHLEYVQQIASEMKDI